MSEDKNQNSLENQEFDFPFDFKVASRYTQTAVKAKKRGKEFSLSFNEIKKLMLKKKCAYTGVTFDESSDTLRMSFDRVDPSKGYVSGNVVAVTVFANNMKNLLVEQTESPNYMGLDMLKKFVDNITKEMKKGS